MYIISSPSFRGVVKNIAIMLPVEMDDEVLCHLCCELMPAPGLDQHLAIAHGEATADAHGEAFTGEGIADACAADTREDAIANEHREASADALGDELNGKDLATNMEISSALGDGDNSEESEVTMEGVVKEVSNKSSDSAEQQVDSGYARANANEREFQCDKCSFSTPFKHNLKTHRLTHTYDCASCPFLCNNHETAKLPKEPESHY